MTTTPTASPRHTQRCFVTTHWSVVAKAAADDTTAARRALDQLCRTYWYPLYAYVRRSGHSPEQAQDLTQEFFARVLQLHWLAQADPAKGRFRSFLLTLLKRFLANEWDRSHARKRGGHVELVPFDVRQGETRYQAEPVDNVTPEQTFERRWAIALLDQVLEKLEQRQVAQGKAELFARLKPCLLGDGSALPCAQLAEALGMTETAVKVAVHRLRREYRQLLREEIASTVRSPRDVVTEMHHLFQVLAAG